MSLHKFASDSFICDCLLKIEWCLASCCLPLAKMKLFVKRPLAQERRNINSIHYYYMLTSQPPGLQKSIL